MTYGTPIRKDDADHESWTRLYAPQPMSHQQIVCRIRHLNSDIAFWKDAPKLESYSRKLDARKIAEAEAEIARLDDTLAEMSAQRQAAE